MTVKPKYKDIDWDKMWKIFPEAEAFACDPNGKLKWYGNKGGFAVGDDGWLWFSDEDCIEQYVGKYKLDDVKWQDTLKVRPKPRSKQGIFRDKLFNHMFDDLGWDATCINEDTENICEIAKEVFGDV